MDMKGFHLAVLSQVSGRGVYILSAAVIPSLFFVSQGLHLMVRGRMFSPFRRRSDTDKVLSYSQRLALALFYLVIGLGLMLLAYNFGRSILFH
jgi:hypothetical protein